MKKSLLTKVMALAMAAVMLFSFKYDITGCYKEKY